MDDLISRAAAIDHMKAMADCAKCDHYNYVRCRACSWDDAMNIVDELPAVDAAPMVHGRWKQTDAYPHWLYCLNCYKRIVPNVEWIEAYNIPTNYCPNCGARMDGERRDDDGKDA